MPVGQFERRYILERLSFAENNTYSGLEASIHIARYLLTRDLCRDKRVLDLACGEGYGSRLMLDWGASEVVGVDVSEESITNANACFGREGLRYLRGDAEKVDLLLGGETFDLIVSLETIEHLHNPVAYLEAIARLRAPLGQIIISCPNDWWYYPEAHQSNPYHVRKYSCDEFLALVDPILGQPDAVGLGLPITGFINLALGDVEAANGRLSQIAMMSAMEVSHAFMVPMEPGFVTPANSSYFIARWGGVGVPIAGTAIHPMPMDVFRNGMYSGDVVRHQQLELEELTHRSNSLSNEISDLQHTLQSERVRQAAMLVENGVLKGNVNLLVDEKARLDGELAVALLAAQRYLRLRSMVPGFALSLGRWLRDILRGGRR